MPEIDKEKNNVLLFAYGTLLNKKICQDLFGEQPTVLAKARLHGWQKITREKYPYLVPQKNSSVEGVILRLTNKQLIIADKWEEVPEVYYRTPIIAEKQDQSQVKAWVYLKKHI